MAVAIALLAPTVLAAEAKREEPKDPQNLAELQAALGRILHASKTPAMSVAVVTKDEVLFAGAFGLANVAKKTPATGDTLFRIGSTSKGFTALAALKLQAEGRLDLNATLASLAPEIEFKNPWEATDPVRIIHLLSHTTGFDDIHLRDYALEDPRPHNLREALAFDPGPRFSRWRPGTRFAYCNAGPAVVACVIEKVTGEVFEDYVRREFFTPIGMTTATYFRPTAGVPAATLYQGDGVTPYDYWNIAMRPAGAINASAKDMAAYVRFYINRGRVGGAVVARAEDIERMERPGPTTAARAGLPTGYGLYNYTSFGEAGRVWHGHNGGVLGGLCDMSYQPEEGVGYAVMTNSTEVPVLMKATLMLRKYLTRDLPKPKEPAEVKIPDDVAARHAGFYVSVSPRVQLFAPIERIANVRRLTFHNGVAAFGSALAKRSKLVGVTPTLLRGEKQTAASVALLTPTEEDEASLVDFSGSYRRVPALVAFGPLVLFLLCELLGLCTVVFVPIWIVLALRGMFQARERLGLLLWPLAATCAMGWLVVAAWRFPSDGQIFAHYGSMTLRSADLAVASIAPLLAGCVGLFIVLRGGRRGAHPMLYAHALLVLGTTSALTLYLAWLGAIPFVTWN